jgi:hypothetical protein
MSSPSLHEIPGEIRPPATIPSLAARHFYSAYGMIIHSEIELPELMAGPPAEPDVTVAFSSIERPDELQSGRSSVAFSPTRHYFHWDAVGTFLISDGCRIEVEPAPGVDDRLLAFPLLGPVMAVLLHLRRHLVLHGSAIAKGGRCIAFLGDKGAGKSTSAGAMLAAGYELLTDDVLAVGFSDTNRAAVLPAFPQIKLAADASAAIRLDGAEVRAQAHPAIDKRQHRLSAGFSARNVPPESIYLLERGTHARVSRLAGGEALVALIRFSYLTRFGRSALAVGDAGLHLKQCAALLGQCTVCRLEVPAGLDRLGEMVALVERNLAPCGARE